MHWFAMVGEDEMATDLLDLGIVDACAAADRFVWFNSYSD